MGTNSSEHRAGISQGAFLLLLPGLFSLGAERFSNEPILPSAPVGCYVPIIPGMDEGPAPQPFGGSSFNVVIATKTDDHPYFGVGHSEGFVIDGIEGRELTLERFATYTFSMNTPSHPFVFTNSAVGGAANMAQVITAGVTNSGATSGTITFTPGAGTPALLYYNCNLHLNMGWKINIVEPPIRLAAKAFLEGPLDAGTLLMSDALRTNGPVPTTEPYTALGYVHSGGGGGETVDPAVFGVTGDDGIVDWVIAELRSSATPSTVLASRSALIQRDGDVVATDGVSPVPFTLGAGDYHVALKHRNHLGVMTAAPLTFSTATVDLDLTTSGTLCFGTNARKTVGTVQALWAGDVTFNGQVKYAGAGNDRDPILTTIGGTVPTATVTGGYRQQDVNMNAQVKYAGGANDRDPILVNIGGSVPTASRSAQLP